MIINNIILHNKQDNKRKILQHYKIQEHRKKIKKNRVRMDPHEAMP